MQDFHPPPRSAFQTRHRRGTRPYTDDFLQSRSNRSTEAVAHFGDKLQPLWLLDSKENPLGRMLRVRTLPTMVLISPDGKILFNGEPADDEFWHALKKVDENIDDRDAEEKKSE